MAVGEEEDLEQYQIVERRRWEQRYYILDAIKRIIAFVEMGKNLLVTFLCLLMGVKMLTWLYDVTNINQLLSATLVYTV